MTGTGELGTRDAETKLAVLVEKAKNTENSMASVTRSLADIAATVNLIQRTQIETNERLQARSEANAKAIVSVETLVRENEKASKARDAQMASVVRDERDARAKALEEQDAKHAADIEDIKSDIKAMSAKLENSVFWSRIMAGVAAVFGVVAGGVLLAAVNHLFP